VVAPNEEAVWKSFRNLGERVQLVTPNELNTYDVLVNDWLVFSTATLEESVARFSTAVRPSAADANATEVSITKAASSEADATEADATEAGDDQ